MIGRFAKYSIVSGCRHWQSLTLRSLSNPSKHHASPPVPLMAGKIAILSLGFSGFAAQMQTPQTLMCAIVMQLLHHHVQIANKIGRGILSCRTHVLDLALG